MTPVLQRFTLGLRIPHADGARQFEPRSEIRMRPEGFRVVRARVRF